MPRLFMSLQMEDRFPIVDIMQQTPPIPEGCQWALFLRNHDELTLEMVTDEERDYMYRAYARDPAARLNLGIRRRLAPLLGNDRAAIELLNGLLFSLPGTPIIYYGDEIGMGDNIYLGDRDGVRTPMQWSDDRNAGFSRVNPQRLVTPVIIDPEYHFEAINVDHQLHSESSLLWWMRRLIAVRRRHPVLARGSLEFLNPDNGKVLAYIRCHGDANFLVVANLSEYAQCASLDLTRFEGLLPRDVFGGALLPRIGSSPYLITLAPRSFFWFSLEQPRVAVRRCETPTLSVESTWPTALAHNRYELASAMSRTLPCLRWYAGKSGEIDNVVAKDLFVMSDGSTQSRGLLIAQVTSDRGDQQLYGVPMHVQPTEGEAGSATDGVFAVLTRGQEQATVHDAMADPWFANAVLRTVLGRSRIRSKDGELVGVPAAPRREMVTEQLATTAANSDQSNSTVLLGEQFALKLFRRLETGIHPEAELGRVLAEARFEHTPRFVGALEYRPFVGEAATIAVLHEYLPNEGTAWALTKVSLRRYLERVVREDVDVFDVAQQSQIDAIDLTAAELPKQLGIEHVGDLAELMGRRIGELHVALNSAGDAAMAPEPMTPHYLFSVSQAMISLARRNFQQLTRERRNLASDAAELASRVLSMTDTVIERFKDLRSLTAAGTRIRTHGDLHLGQVLFTGKDFSVIDFEGEPVRVLSERRIKRSPLRDVAGMLRSFDYAGRVALDECIAAGLAPSASPQLDTLSRATELWVVWNSAAFLRGYLSSVDRATLPATRSDLRVMLSAFVTDKAVYEVGYELSHRPDWVGIPLRGLVDLGGG
jgi:maltose alpha-D-glucosyltransferase/alpha-amylase